MADFTKEPGFISKIGDFIVKYPAYAMIIWLCYRDVKRDVRDDEKTARIEERETAREKERNEELKYFRDAKQEELRLKEKELNMKYEKDSIK